MRRVLLAALLTGCRAPVPVAGHEGVDPPDAIAPVTESEPGQEPTSDTPVRLHIGGAIQILEEGEAPDPKLFVYNEDWWRQLDAALAATTSRDVLVTILDRQSMVGIESVINNITHRGGRARLQWMTPEGEATQLSLRRSAGSEKPPADCTRVRLHLEGRGIRVDLERESDTSRLGRVMETSALAGELAAVDPRPCPDVVVEVFDHYRWSEVAEVLPTVAALGATELVLGSRTLFARQRYDAYPWSKSLGRVRVNRVLAGWKTGVEGHRAYWSVGPPRGEALFEGPLTPWPAHAFVLELPAGEYDLDVHGVIRHGGSFHECGTTTRVRARREVSLHHNLRYASCTVAPKAEKPQPSAKDPRQLGKPHRPVTIQRDAGKAERKPWVLRVTTIDGTRSNLFEFLVPPALAEITLQLPDEPLAVAFREVTLSVDRPTEWCMGSFGGKECRALEAEAQNFCEAEISDPGPQVVTYRPGKDCAVRRPGKKSKPRR